MNGLVRRADRLDEAAATLTAAGHAVVGGPPDPADLAADHPGRPGELGRELHGRWLAALDAREREALAAAARLAEVAAAVRTAAAGYADTDDDTRRRHDREA
ncbi:hypothetical protein [Micromonospora zhanjiangensis]|uniref:Excreted virulence factor EspC, type VII ESX diderm n=1 Tax=Micromonospora zhanjiangensis TaxID=1522057 RepID=A0ABV8KNX8_9ACTN